MIKPVLLKALIISVLTLFIGPKMDRDFLTKGVYEEVSISYKWKKYGLFKKDKPPRLVLKIKNWNNHPVLISFQVDYYWNAILHSSSEKVKYCVKPKRQIKGRLWDLVFTAGNFDETQIKDVRFMWDLSELEIKHHSDCKAHLTIKMRPEIQ